MEAAELVNVSAAAVAAAASGAPIPLADWLHHQRGMMVDDSGTLEEKTQMSQLFTRTTTVTTISRQRAVGQQGSPP